LSAVLLRDIGLSGATPESNFHVHWAIVQRQRPETAQAEGEEYDRRSVKRKAGTKTRKRFCR
jgi:hypothetical protein